MIVIGNYDVHTVYCVIRTTVHSNIEATPFFYRPCREEREGYVFTLVCYQVTTPPSSRLCAGWWYAFYWNALLFIQFLFLFLCCWFCFDFVGGDAKQMYTYARANYRNAFIRFINVKDLTR